MLWLGFSSMESPTTVTKRRLEGDLRTPEVPLLWGQPQGHEAGVK